MSRSHAGVTPSAGDLSDFSNTRADSPRETIRYRGRHLLLASGRASPSIPGGRPEMLEILEFIQALNESSRTLRDCVIAFLAVRQAFRTSRSDGGGNEPPEQR